MYHCEMREINMITSIDQSFEDCLKNAPDLAALLPTYAGKSSGERPMAAQWESDSALANYVFRIDVVR